MAVPLCGDDLVSNISMVNTESCGDSVQMAASLVIYIMEINQILSFLGENADINSNQRKPERYKHTESYVYCKSCVLHKY